MHVRIRNGLDLPLAGAPRQQVSQGRAVRTVAVLGRDLPGPRPEVLVAVGDAVRTGQPVCRDRRKGAIVAVSPAAGTVLGIHRGERRRLESIVIEVGGNEAVACATLSPTDVGQLSRTEAVRRLLASGLWSALRRRPYECAPDPNHTPRSLFVTAMDTRPGAPSVAALLEGETEAFEHGLRLLTRIAPVHVCSDPVCSDPVSTKTAGSRSWARLPGVQHSTFAGPHPAGLPGTHIHFLDPIEPGQPIGQGNEVWHIGAASVIALGHLLATGRPWTDRVVALSGPLVRDPRLVRTRLGASLEDLLEGELRDGEARVIAGSVLDGSTARAPAAYLGVRDQQVSVLAEPRGDRPERRPRFSAAGILTAWLRRRRPLALTTDRNGRRGPIPAIPAYRRVMPLDLQPVPLLRALAVRDVEAARTLGCLELAEEDLALCTFVCPAKGVYGPLLRRVLDQIEKAG